MMKRLPARLAALLAPATLALVPIALSDAAHADPLDHKGLPQISVNGSSSPVEELLQENGAASTSDADTPTVPGVPRPGATTLPEPLPDLPLSYRVRTLFTTSDGDVVERFTDAVLLVPTPIDVDGDAAPDLLAQLVIDAGRATVRTTVLASAPTPLPLLVEAIVADPRGTTDLRVAYGFDASMDTAPSVFQSTVQLIGAARITSFAMDVETVAPGEQLAVIGEVYEEGPNGARVDPQRGRILYSPVPAAAHIGLLQGSDLGIQQSGVDLATSLPTRVEVTLEDIQGARTIRGDVVIDRLPNVLSLILTDADDGRRTWSYQASARVQTLSLAIVEQRGADIVDEFALLLEDMALQALLIQDTPTHATFEATTPIGVLAAGSARGQSITWLDAPAYLYSTDRGLGESFAFRILGLRQAELDTGDPFLVDVRMSPGPFQILIEDGARVLDGRITDLPDHVRILFSTTAGTIDYTGSAPIDAIVIDVTDPDGLAGRATDLHLALGSIPTQLSLAYGTEGGVARMDARPGAVGSVDLLLTSGPVIEVDAGFDGIVQQDVESHYAIAVRLTGLRLVSVTTGAPPYTVELQKAPGPFLVHLIDGTRTIRGEIHDLPDQMVATIDPAGGLSYAASASIDLITVNAFDPEGLGGRATQLSLSIADVPPNLTLDFSTENRAIIDVHGDRIGRIDLLLTSGPTLEVDEGYDGVVVEDIDSHYAVAARITGLRIVDATMSSPYVVTLGKDAGPFVIRLLRDGSHAEILIHDLPDHLQATLDSAGSLSYEASAPIGELRASFEDPDGVVGRAVAAHALFQDLPPALTVTWGAADGSVTADAQGETVGLIEVLMTSGPITELPPSRDGVILEDLADRYVLFARITGLRRVSFIQGPPPSFDLRTTGGRVFEVSVRTQRPSGEASTTALIETLPADIAIQFDSATSLTYRASHPVASVRIDAFDPDGISGRATEMHALLTSLPVALDASWSAAGVITLDAKGGTVGLIELQLTSGPDNRLPSSVDGILLEDLADRYVVFARFTGLQRIVGTQEPQPDITLQTTGGRVFRADLNQLSGGKIVYTRATLTTLPTSVRVRVGDREMFYEASSTAQSLVFDTNSGDRWNLHADVRDPVPANLYLCQASNGFCNGFARSSGGVSFKLIASQHTTINIFDCNRPLNANCVPGGASEFTRLDNWRVRHFEFDADFDDVGFSGYTFNNTNGHSLQGYLLRIGGSTGFEADIRPGYWSQNRRVSWDAWGLFKSRSGSVNCAGSSFSVRVLGFWLGVTDYVC